MNKNPSDPVLSDNALITLKKRYLLKDRRGDIIESPADLFHRVASTVARSESLYGGDEDRIQSISSEFYELMAARKFLPNSPTLMNAGRELGQLSACFVLPVEDSMEGIFETLKNAAIIHKSGGGTGFSFSKLRPQGAHVASTSGVASGPVSFMRVFNSATEAVKQGGTRRGANMAILRVDHPDILEFISCKKDTGDFVNFNISVAVTDQFMRALSAGDDYELIPPGRDKQGSISIVGESIYLSSESVWRKIAQSAWETGEPGVVFIDRMRQGNPTNMIENIEATNPCGEQPLPDHDSCTLGSLNLGLFVIEKTASDKDTIPKIDWKKLGYAVRLAVRFLDNVIDANRYPLPEIEEQTRKNRRIGLGVMGWADFLVKMGVSYDSTAARELADKTFSFINMQAKEMSTQLADERGVFPNWDSSTWAPDIRLRNATITTVAPTGTISIIANCSSGIEPYYALLYERNVLDGEKLKEVNPLFERIAKDRGFYSKELIQQISQVRSIQEIESIPVEIRTLFKIAEDISGTDHLKTQAVFQKYSDSSVSKTINLPPSSSVEDIYDIFLEAYSLGLKGVTVYRDNSRPGQALNTCAFPEAEVT